MTTTRRKAVGALLCLSAGAALHGSALNPAAWRAYEAVEEAWIRDRHALLLQQCPECAEVGAMDLELKLAELQRRGLQFDYLSRHNPQQLRGGMWQLSWLPLSNADTSKMTSGNPEYRKQEEKIRRLAEDLRKHSAYELLNKSQMRLWKTPEYRSLHRRYSGRLQELNRIYSSSLAGTL